MLDLEHTDWTYKTGATGGAGIAFFAASGGAIYLLDPAKREHRYIFGGIGAGWSFGFKLPRGIKAPRLPKIPKVRIRGKDVGFAGSITDFPSGGIVFRNVAKVKGELTAEDIRGAVLFVEGALGLVAGGSGDAMLFGMNPLLVAAALGNTMVPFLMEAAIDSAAGAMLFGGVNVGLQAGGGVAGLVGYMH